MSVADIKVKEIKPKIEREALKLTKQVLVNFGLGRKKVFLLDGQNTLSSQFKTYIKSDPAFSCLFKKRFLVFQEFNQKFGTWVDIDGEESLSDGTVVKAMFFPKKIEIDENNPVSIKRGRLLEDPECSYDVMFYSEDQKDITSCAVEEIDLCEDSENELPLEKVVQDVCQENSKKSKSLLQRKGTACVSKKYNDTSLKNEGVEEVGSTTDSVSHASEANSAYVEVESVAAPLLSFNSSGSCVESTRQSDNVQQGPVVHSVSDIKCTACVLQTSPDISGESCSAENVLSDCGTSTAHPNVRYSSPVHVPFSSKVSQSENVPLDKCQETYCGYSTTKCCASSSTGYEDPDVNSLIQDHHSPYACQSTLKDMQVRHRDKVLPKRIVAQNKVSTGTASTTQHENVAQLITSDTGTVSSNDNSQGRSGQSCHQETGIQNSSTKQKNGNVQRSRSRLHISSNIPVAPVSTHRLLPLDFKCWHEKHEVTHSLKARNTRLQWAKDASRRDKSWRLNIFSDVSAFVLSGNHIKRVSQDIRSLNEILPPTFEMFWGCLTYKGPEVLVPLGDHFESEVLSGILRDKVVPFVKIRYPNVISRLQYYSCFSCHYKRFVVSEIMRKNLMDLELWPNCVRDLSPLEHVWDLIAEKVQNIYCSNKEEMISVIMNIWQKDSDLQLMSRKFVASMQDIVNSVITQRGKCPEIMLELT